MGVIEALRYEPYRSEHVKRAWISKKNGKPRLADVATVSAADA